MYAGLYTFFIAVWPHAAGAVTHKAGQQVLDLDVQGCSQALGELKAAVTALCTTLDQPDGVVPLDVPESIQLINHLRSRVRQEQQELELRLLSASRDLFARIFHASLSSLQQEGQAPDGATCTAHARSYSGVAGTLLAGACPSRSHC